MSEDSMIERKLALKEQAIKFLAMHELWAELEKGAEMADERADKSLGEEHQRHVGAKIGLREFMQSVRYMADYEVPVETKQKGNYA